MGSIPRGTGPSPRTPPDVGKRTLTADELVVYRQLIRYQTVPACSRRRRRRTSWCCSSHALLQKGFFRAAKGASPLLEETIIKPSPALQAS